MSADGPLRTVVPMSQHGDSPDTLAAARQTLAARDADLADADRALAAVVGDAHALAVESIGRIDAIGAELDAAGTTPHQSPAGAHELSRHLITKSRDIADVLNEVKAAAHTKALALKALSERYR